MAEGGQWGELTPSKMQCLRVPGAHSGEEAGGRGLGRERGGWQVALHPPPCTCCRGAAPKSWHNLPPPPPHSPPVQERCSEVKAELREVLGRHGIKQHRMVPVKRNYAFEVEGVPHGEQYCIKVWTGRMCGGRMWASWLGSSAANS